MAPPTEHDLAVEARDHPAARGGLLDGQHDGLARRRHHVNAIGRKSEPLPDQPVDGRGAHAFVGVGRHALAKRRQLVAGLALQLRDGGRAERPPRFGDELGVERRQTFEQRLTGGVRGCPALRPGRRPVRARPGRSGRRMPRRGRRSLSRRSAAARRAAGARAAIRRARGLPPGQRTPSPSGKPRGKPRARRHSSNTSRTSASQKSMRTGRRRGPFW